MTDKTNDFDVAKALFSQLEGLEKDRQIRILRWVAETLNITCDLSSSGVLRLSPQPAVSPANQPPQAGRTAAGAARPADIKTFMETKNPRSDVQFATAVAYYYRFEAPEDQRKETITREDLQNATRLVNRDRLKQPRLTLNNAKNSGYLDSVARGAFKINTVGENLVAMTLPGQQGDSKSTTVRGQRPQKADTKKK